VCDRVTVGLEPACIKACPTGCLHFGTKGDMKVLAEDRAHNFASTSISKTRASTIRSVGGTGVIYVLHDVKNPEAYGGLPRDPHVPWVVRIGKPGEVAGNLAMSADPGRYVAYLRFGPKRLEPRRTRE